jgi:CRP/FNR family transcriptional regulator, cyclic AMP receptor protein
MSGVFGNRRKTVALSSFAKLLSRHDMLRQCEKRVSIFRQFEILKELPEAALQDLSASCFWQSVSAGRQILMANEDGREVYFVAAGKVRILLYSAAEGRPVLFTIYGPHEMFGEMAAIDGRPRSATVEAEEDCVIAILPYEQFLRLVGNYPAFAWAVMTQLTSQVRRLTERVFEFSTLGVESRIFAELLRCVSPADERRGQALLSPPPHRNDLAARVSTNREAVSRAITVLKKEGIVRKEGKNLRILKLEGLRMLVKKARGE